MSGGVLLIDGVVGVPSSGGGGNGTGTVTSVSFTGDGVVLSSTPSSAVTTAGTLTATLVAYSPNLVLATGTSGANATPTFRSLVGADLPNPSNASKGGVLSYAPVANQWVNSIGTNGTPTSTQPAFANISGNISSTQLPLPSNTTLGGIFSAAPVSHQWVNSIGTNGTPTLSQPSTADISGLGTIATQNSTNVTIAGGTIDGTIIGGTTTAAGKFTTINASGILTQGSGLVQAVRVVTAAGNITAATTDYYICVNKTVGANSTVNLFATPTTGTTLVIKDSKGDSGTHPILIVPAAGTIDGAANYTLNVNFQAAQLFYSGSEWGVA